MQSPSIKAHQHWAPTKALVSHLLIYCTSGSAADADGYGQPILTENSWHPFPLSL